MIPSATFEHAFNWLRAGDIEPDPKVDPRKMQADAALARRAQVMRAVFSGRDGELALQTILEATLFRSPIDASLPRDGTFENYALLREGQNQLAATILAYIQTAIDQERTDHATGRTEPGAGLWGTEPRPDPHSGPDRGPYPGGVFAVG